jgi:hypothetical protein
VKQLDDGVVAGWSVAVPVLVAGRLSAVSRDACHCGEMRLGWPRVELWPVCLAVMIDEASTAARR